jgi:hypothetical protein
MSNFFEDWGWAVVIFAIFAALIVIGLIGDAAICNAKTSGMGFASRWSPLGGCQIEVNPNQWIPLDSYYFKEE